MGRELCHAFLVYCCKTRLQLGFQFRLKKQSLNFFNYCCISFQNVNITDYQTTHRHNQPSWLMERNAEMSIFVLNRMSIYVIFLKYKVKLQ